MITFESYLSEQSENTKASKIFHTQVDNVELFALATLLGSEPFNAHTNASLLWEKVKDTIFLDTESKVTERIHLALKKARQQLIMLIRNDPDFKEIGIDLHLTILIIEGNKMYIGNLGENDIYLIRKTAINIGKMITKEDNIFHTGSGVLEDGDLLMISSPNIADAYIDTQFDEIAAKTPQEIVNNDLKELSQEFSSNQTVLTINIHAENKEIQNEQNQEIKPYEESNPNKNLAPIISAIDKIKSFTKPIISNAYTKTQPLLNKAAIYMKNMKDRIIKPRTQENLTNNIPEQHDNIIPQSVTNDPANKFYKPYELKGINQINNEKPLSGTYRRSPLGRKLMGVLSLIPIKPKVKPDKLKTSISIPLYKKKYVQILFFILIVAIILFFLINSKLKANRYKLELKNITTQVVELENISTQIDKLVSNPSYKREEVETLIDQAKTLKAKISLNNIKNEDKTSLENRIKTVDKNVQMKSNTINFIYPVDENTNTKIVVDTLAACDKEDKPLDFAFNDPYVLIIGETKSSLCIVNIKTNESMLLDKQHNVGEQPVSVTAYDHGFYVLDDKKGILQIQTIDGNSTVLNPSTMEVKAVSALTRSSIGNADEIEVYGEPGNQNIYFLSITEGKVRKALNVKGSFGFPQDYFRNDEFTQAVDILIDGNIFITTNSPSKIIKYQLGNPDAISISDTYPNINKLGHGFTQNSDKAPIYLIDHQPTYERILILEKPYAVYNDSGNLSEIKHPGKLVLLKQLTYQGERDDLFKNLREVIANEDGKYLYILDGTKLLRVEL